MKANTTMTIGEAAASAGVPPKTIRFYESSGIIGPAARTANRYRAYSNADVETLRFVQRARALGFSLKDVAALLGLYRDRNRASKDVKRLALQHVAELERKIAEMSAIRDTIAALAKRCHGDERPNCPILDELDSAAPESGRRLRRSGTARTRRAPSHRR